MYIMYNLYMKVYSVSEGRKILGELIHQVKHQKKVIALGKHGKADVLLVACEDAHPLDRLLEQVTPDMLHDESDFGEPAGMEVW